MKFFVALLCFVISTVPIQAKDKPAKIALDEAELAYSDAKALKHKASAFIHARTAYRLARNLYPNNPTKLALYSWRYAQAAAQYRDPLALFLFEQTLDIHVSAFAPSDARFVAPLIDAADEALQQSEPEMAYAWYMRARKILTRHESRGSFNYARVLMGLARLHKSANQLKKADEKAEKAAVLLKQHYSDIAPIAIASMLFRFGEIIRANGHDTEAFEAYTKSLSLFQQHDKSASEIYGLHKRLVEVNHKLGNEDAVTAHCVAAQQFHFTNMRKPISGIVYDPTGRLSGTDRQKQGKIRATFRKGVDCRLHDIEIHYADGISQKDAKMLLAQAYYAPIMMRGIISKGEYLTLSTLAVYKK